MPERPPSPKITSRKKAAFEGRKRLRQRRATNVSYTSSAAFSVKAPRCGKQHLSVMGSNKQQGYIEVVSTMPAPEEQQDKETALERE